MAWSVPRIRLWCSPFAPGSCLRPGEVPASSALLSSDSRCLLRRRRRCSVSQSDTSRTWCFSRRRRFFHRSSLRASLPSADLRLLASAPASMFQRLRSRCRLRPSSPSCLSPARAELEATEVPFVSAAATAGASSPDSASLSSAAGGKAVWGYVGKGSAAAAVLAPAKHT